MWGLGAQGGPGGQRYVRQMQSAACAFEPRVACAGKCEKKVATGRADVSSQPMVISVVGSTAMTTGRGVLWGGAAGSCEGVGAAGAGAMHGHASGGQQMQASSGEPDGLQTAELVPRVEPTWAYVESGMPPGMRARRKRIAARAQCMLKGAPSALPIGGHACIASDEDCTGVRGCSLRSLRDLDDVGLSCVRARRINLRDVRRTFGAVGR